ncbi:MAG TPA: hypothetical protein VNV38_22235 [Stellaceae bacterium]|nr:hypothetical protein [Stellaceae bacterium]
MNPTHADAILDRLFHNAHRLDLAGDSLSPNPTASSCCKGLTTSTPS